VGVSSGRGCYGHIVSLRQLKWTTIVGPLVFLALIDFLRRTVLPEPLRGWLGEILLGGIILFATLLFSETIFERIERMQKRVEQQNRELLALHEAGLDVAGELSLELVLQKSSTTRASSSGHAMARCPCPRRAAASTRSLRLGSHPSSAR
ncbi:MAG TPA: hypothetical protein VGL99_31870, partial [Chloroflexota bacterium]